MICYPWVSYCPIVFCTIVFHSIACSVATKCIDQHFFVVGWSGTSNFLKRDRQHAVVEDYPIKKTNYHNNN